MTNEMRLLPKMAKIGTFLLKSVIETWATHGSQLARHKKPGILSHENKSSNANGMVHVVFEGRRQA